MLMAARKLQGIGLVLFVLLMAMALYPVSLKVAQTRSELAAVEYDLRQTQLNIRYLETEFSARASMRQLERWNAQSLGYVAPEAAQFLSGERELAQLDRLRPVDAARADRRLLAVATVPPVVRETKSAAERLLEASIPSARAAEPAGKSRDRPVAAETDRSARPAATVATAPAATREDKAPSREQRLAMLDRQLLTPAALNAIDAAASAELGARTPK